MRIEANLASVTPQDVMLPTPSGDDNENTYFEQITFSGGTYRTGDCVYVRTETTNLMARIEKMWTDKQGKGFFHGPWFVTPQEIHSSGAAPGRQYFRQEVFLSSIEDTNPLLAITGRCHVMDPQEYMTSEYIHTLEFVPDSCGFQETVLSSVLNGF